jgi:hypothetical protein
MKYSAVAVIIDQTDLIKVNLALGMHEEFV